MFSIYRTGRILKLISVIVAGIFLWNQIAWAADLTVPTAPQEELAEAGLPAEDLEANQDTAESLVDSKNAIETFAVQSEPLMELCIEPPPPPSTDPTYIEYETLTVDGIDYTIENTYLADGTLIRYAGYDPDGNIVGYINYNPDTGKPTDILMPNGNYLTFYADGSIKSKTLLDTTLFEYSEDGKTVTETRPDGSKTVSEYYKYNFFMFQRYVGVSAIEHIYN